LEEERRGLQEKIFGMLGNDPSLYQALKAANEPAIAALAQGLRPAEAQRGPPVSDQSFYRDNEPPTSAMGKPMQRTDMLDKPSYGGTSQRFNAGNSLLGDPYGSSGGLRGDPYGASAGVSLLGEPPSRIGSAPQAGSRDSSSAGQDFKNLQEKIFDMFQGRDTKPSAAQVASASYGQGNEGYGGMTSNEFNQQRMGFTGDAPRASDRPGLLGNPFESTPANGRLDYQSAGQFAQAPAPQPGGNASQFGMGSFNKPPPGFTGQPVPGFRDAGPQARQGTGSSQMQGDWMQGPQRYSRFS
jgi:hypothetical protein